MHGACHSKLDRRAKAVVAVVASGVLAGQVIAFLGGPANTAGWDLVRFPCECAWAVLAFPLGWLGWIAPRLVALAAPRLIASRSLVAWQYCPYLFLWTGVLLNACFWGGVVYGVARYNRRQGGRHGLDASMFFARLSELRPNHLAAAHARSRPMYARKGLVAVARQAVTRQAYFTNKKPEGHPDAETETHAGLSPNG